GSVCTRDGPRETPIAFAQEHPVANNGSASFRDHFQDLQDPRVERTRKHPLINVLFIAVCGVLSGANSFASIHEDRSRLGEVRDPERWSHRQLRSTKKSSPTSRFSAEAAYSPSTSPIPGRVGAG